jgi:hypothetical protein
MKKWFKKWIERMYAKHHPVQQGVLNFVISTALVQCVLKALPDPNQFMSGNMTNEDWNKCFEYFVERGEDDRPVMHKVSVISMRDNKVMVHVENYDYRIIISCSLLVVNGENIIIAGSNGIRGGVEIDTHVWDFDKSGIRIISDAAWQHIRSFQNACKNVKEEFSI